MTDNRRSVRAAPGALADTLDARLRNRLNEIGLSQTELARRAGLSTSYISDLVLGRRGNRIGIRTASALRDALGVDDSFFMPTRSVKTESASVMARRVRVHDSI